MPGFENLPGAVGFLNHLVGSEDWTRERLKPFAGKTARLQSGALSLSLEITADGLFRSAAADPSRAVCITLPADAPLRVVTGGRAALLAAAQISGAAELAETLAFIFRNLRWDIEADLAPLLGDIAARRLVAGGRQLARWQIEQGKNLAVNLAEYFTEESPLIARRRDVSAFCAETGELAESLSRIEQRIAALER